MHPHLHPHYFDALPLHPQPESDPPESYTGYIIRLAEENHIHRTSDIKDLFFADRSLGYVSHLSDVPPISFGALPSRAVCPEERLLQTTLYHLPKKFGRSIGGNSVAKWLAGCTAPHLRYCPFCVAERGYYALPWRFLWVDGCPVHGCALLDRCGHCGNTIKLLPPLLKIGFCPTCRNDVRSCQARPLSVSERQAVSLRWGEVEWLVSPQPCEQDPTGYLKDLGHRLIDRRKEEGHTREAIAGALGMGLWNVIKIEGTGIEDVGAPLARYVTYAHHVGVDLRDPVTTPMCEPIRFSARAVKRFRVNNDDLPQRVQNAIKALKCPTLYTIARAIHVEQGRLLAHPEVVDILKSHGIANPTWLEREEEVLAWVERTIDAMQGHGPLTVTAIMRAMGCSEWFLYRFPRVRMRLGDVARERDDSKRAQSRANEDVIVEQVLSAVDQLKSVGAYATANAVGALLGRRTSNLRRYPHARPILASLASESRRERSDERDKRDLEMAADVVAAIRSLRSQAGGRPPSERAVSRFMGISREILRRGPRTRAALTQPLRELEE